MDTSLVGSLLGAAVRRMQLIKSLAKNKGFLLYSNQDAEDTLEAIALDKE